MVCALSLCAAKNRAEPVTWWEAELPSTLHPLWAASTLDLRAQAPIYDNLVEPTVNGWVSALTTDIQVEAGTIRLVLRRDIRWQDGKKLSSADICATVDALRSKTEVTPLGSRLGRRLQHCAALASDEWTVVIHLADTGESDPLSALHFPVLPSHLGPLTDIDHPIAQAPVGTGPWAATVGDKSISYRAHRTSHLPALTLSVAPDWPTEEQLAQVQGWPRLPVSQIPRLREMPSWSLYPYRMETVIGLALDTSEPPFSSQSLRQAVDGAINRDALCKDLVGNWPDANPPPCRPTISPFAESAGVTNHGIPIPELVQLPEDPLLQLTIAIPAELEIDAVAMGRWLTGSLVPYQVDIEILPLAELIRTPATDRRKRWDVVVFARTPADSDLRPELGMDGQRNWFTATDRGVLDALRANDPDDWYDLHAVVADQRLILPLVELNAMSAWSSGISPAWMTPVDGLGSLRQWGFSAEPRGPRRR